MNFFEKIKDLEALYTDIVNFSKTFYCQSGGEKEFDYSPLLTRTTRENLFLFFAMKAISRSSKNKRPFFAYSCDVQSVPEVLADLIKLKKYDTDFFIIVEEDQHFFTLAVRFLHNGTLEMFHYDSYYTFHETDFIESIIPEILKYPSNVYFYKYVGEHTQFSQNGCFWFALEATFRLSNVNIFSVFNEMKSNKTAFKKEVLSQNKELLFFNEQQIPLEIASVFRSCQSNTKTYSRLPAHIKNAVASSKIDIKTGLHLTLHQSIIQRNALGFNYFRNHYELRGEVTSGEWPNNIDEQSPLYKNWSIVYFKMKQLEKIIEWLKIPSNQIFAQKVVKCKNILEWYYCFLRL